MKNIVKYNAEMRKSLIDKIFFIDKIDSQLFVDYGCADGIMLKFLADLFPDSKFVGYDNNAEMIQIAKANLTNMHKNIQFTNDLKIDETNKILCKLRDGKGPPLNSTVIASSIFHEMYCYEALPNGENLYFWTHIQNTCAGLKYVVIRDMCVSSKVFNQQTDLLSVAQIYHEFGPNKVELWENRWGSLNEKKSMIHFLLKYRYMSMNWDREFEENYLSYDLERLLNDIPKDYKIVHIEHYTLPFLKNQIKKDLNIDFNEKTHIKLILEKV